MSVFDPQYAADAVAWAVVWSGVGLVGRKLLADHESRQDSRRGRGSKR